MNLVPLLKFAVGQGASDIHLQAGDPPGVRVAGLIRHVEGQTVTAEDLRALLESIAPPRVAADLDAALAHGDTFSATVPDVGRFRCAGYTHQGRPGVALRVIPPAIRSIEELGLPPAVRDIALIGRGLVLVVGPAGSGRTTTLAALVDLINGASSLKILTIEAPVEYVHAPKKSHVTQVEVGLDAADTAEALGRAAAQDADVVVLGEIRDGATARLALQLVESGRKVMATMLAPFAIPAVERIVNMVPADERRTAMTQMGSGLDGVLAQRLVPTRDGKRRVAVEVLRGGPITSKTISAGRLDDLNYQIASRQGGMQTLDQHLVELHQAGIISGTETLRLARDTEAVASDLRAARQAAG